MFGGCIECQHEKEKKKSSYSLKGRDIQRSETGGGGKTSLQSSLSKPFAVQRRKKIFSKRGKVTSVSEGKKEVSPPFWRDKKKKKKKKKKKGETRRASESMRTKGTETTRIATPDRKRKKRELVPPNQWGGSASPSCTTLGKKSFIEKPRAGREGRGKRSGPLAL